MSPDRGELLLDAIVDDIDHSLNPDGDECWHCGGDGETFDCFDGFCLEADMGCPDCRRPCPECRIHTRNRFKAIREAVIQSRDTDIAIAWLKMQGRWSDDIPRERVEAEMAEMAKRLSPAQTE